MSSRYGYNAIIRSLWERFDLKLEFSAFSLNIYEKRVLSISRYPSERLNYEWKLANYSGTIIWNGE